MTSRRAKRSLQKPWHQQEKNTPDCTHHKPVVTLRNNGRTESERLSGERATFFFVGSQDFHSCVLSQLKKLEILLKETVALLCLNVSISSAERSLPDLCLTFLKVAGGDDLFPALGPVALYIISFSSILVCASGFCPASSVSVGDDSFSDGEEVYSLEKRDLTSAAAAMAPEKAGTARPSGLEVGDETWMEGTTNG